MDAAVFPVPYEHPICEFVPFRDRLYGGTVQRHNGEVVFTIGHAPAISMRMTPADACTFASAIFNQASAIQEEQTHPAPVGEAS